MAGELALLDRKVDESLMRLRASGSPAAANPLASGGVMVSPLQAQTGALGGWGDSASEYQFGRFFGWTYNAIRPIAQTIAGLPFRAGRVVTDATPQKSGRRRIKTPAWLGKGPAAAGGAVEVFDAHPILENLARPNSIMGGWALKYLTAVWLELTGWAHWWVAPRADKSGLFDIWPLPKHWVTAIHDKGPFSSWAVRPGGSGEPVPVPGQEVVAFYYPDPANPLEALSPNAAQFRAVRTDETLQRVQDVAVQNGIWPGLAVIAGDIVDDDGQNQGPPMLEHEQRQAIYSAIKRMVGGSYKYNEPIILDAIIRDVKEITRKPVDLDFKEGSALVKSRIVQGHGVHPFIMGEAEATSYASAYTSRLHFADFTINPKVELISETLTQRLVRLMAPGEPNLVLWLGRYNPEERTELRADVVAASAAAAISRREVRESLPGLSGLSPMVGGDDALVNFGLMPMAIRTEDRPQAEATEMPEQEPEARARPLMKRREARLLSWEKAHGRREKELARVLRDYFDEQREAAVERLRAIARDGWGAGGRALADALFDSDEWRETMVKAVRPVLLAIMLEGAAEEWIEHRAARLARKQDDRLELPPSVAEAIRDELDTILERPYWQEMQEYTKARLAATLNEAIENGESLYEMAVRIGDSPTVPVPGGEIGVLGSESNTIRGRLIARTETTGAFGAGHEQAIGELAAEGIVAEKVWVSLLDAYTRDTHIEADGQTVGVTEDFVVGGERCPYPGWYGLSGAERCNCRCVHLGE